MADQLSNFLGGFSSLASDSNTKIFTSSARPVHASEQYADYDFISLLGLAQRLHVGFLPIIWQAPLGQMGKGGQAGINEALANIQTSFAFKLFNRPQQHPLREVTQEIVALSHPVIRKHEYIVTLEGICWDIPEDDHVWPVLVFEKSHLGDLHSFAKREIFKDLSIEDRLNLCANVGIAIRDMHSNGIIHGDIKPENVLIFEDDSGIVAKVADFGFATCFQGHNDSIAMPTKEPWDAPEYHDRSFKPEKAKQMDVYSFGLLCFWLIFKAGSSVDLPLSIDTNLESGRFFSFERIQPKQNLLQLWRRDSRLSEWVCWLVHRDGQFDDDTKTDLESFFRSTLAFEPQSRCTEFDQLLGLLVPDRDLPETEFFQLSAVPKQEDFKIPSSILDFYGADFRLREFIVQCLQSTVTESTKPTSQQLSPHATALQLALSYTIGFGTIKDDENAASILRDHSLENTDLRSQVQLIIDGYQEPLDESGLFSLLQHQGTVQYIDFAQYYREKGLLERAEIRLKLEIQSVQSVFSQSHGVCSSLKSVLASLYRNQGRWKEAEELGLQVVEIRKEVQGEEHSDTLTSKAKLALTYWDQGRLKEAEELEVQVIEIRKRVLGEEHPDTLTSMANLASINWNQGRWKEAEELDEQVMEISKKTLGEKHPDTLTSMANLASTYSNQGRWKEAEKLELQVKEINKKVRGEEHPDTLISMANLASTYRNQGRWKEAEKLEVQVMEISKKVRGEEHLDTISSIANLASIYWNQGRWKEAEKLEMQVIETRKRVLGEEHPSTLGSITMLYSP
ncbi:MAG: hypothetical protein Q9171_006900 [Xanthocarpia ochracea]